MVYFTDFAPFFDCAKEMFTSSPGHTRFVTKYRNCDGALVLKVTNDIECLKYKTDSSADLKHVERLTSWFLSQSTRKHIAGAGKGGSGGAVTSGGGAGGDE